VGGLQRVWGDKTSQQKKTQGLRIKNKGKGKGGRRARPPKGGVPGEAGGRQNSIHVPEKGTEDKAIGQRVGKKRKKTKRGVMWVVRKKAERERLQIE